MSRRLRPHLSYANVVSTISLFLVLGGGAFAAARITGRDIVNGSVGSADLRDNGVRGKDIRNGTVTGRDVRDRSLLSSDFRPGSLPTGARGPAGPNGSPDTAAQVRSKLETVDGPGSGLDADLLDGQQGSAFLADGDSAGGDLSGTFSNLQIQPGAVGISEVAVGAIGRGELQSGGPLKAGNFDPPSIAAGACYMRAFTEPDANRGEVVITSPEQDLGAGIFMVPTVVGHDGEAVFEICNSSGAPVDPGDFTTFFDFRFIG